MKNEKETRTSSQSQQPRASEAVDIIKDCVKATFEKLNNLDGEIGTLQKIKSSLKRDLVDLKEGRLDRIVERQEIDPVSKAASVLRVEIKVEVNGKSNSPWYVPYFIYLEKFPDGEKAVVNNSITKINASGSYKLQSGEIKFL